MYYAIVFFNEIPAFEILDNFKFIALTWSCAHVMGMFKLIPGLIFYHSHFTFGKMLLVDGLLDTVSRFYKFEIRYS